MSKLKTYKYSCSGNVAWTSWDHGEVKAHNPTDAWNFAAQEMQKNLDLANMILAGNVLTKGMSVGMSFNDLEVEEVKPISKFCEVKIEHIDDNDVAHIDGYKSEDFEAEGIILGYIVNGEVYWTNSEYQFDEYVMNVIKDFKKHQEA